MEDFGNYFRPRLWLSWSLLSFLRQSPRALTIFAVALAARVVLALTGFAPGFALFLTFVLVILGFILGVQLIRYIVRHSIWRLLNRLLVTYVFIAVVPIVLILILATIGGYFVAGQVAIYLVSSDLDRRAASLAAPASYLAKVPDKDRATVGPEVATLLRDRFPQLELVIHSKAGDYHYPDGSGLALPPQGWGDTSGLVEKNGRYYLWAHVANAPSEVVIMTPVAGAPLSDLVKGLGAVTLFGVSDQDSGAPGVREGRAQSGRVPRAYNRADIQVYWAELLNVAYWDNPHTTRRTAMTVTTRPSAFLMTVFGQKLEVAQVALIVFIVVSSLFFLVELVSLVIGISLTRTITRAVHNLYEGTRRIMAGDFGHRIQVRGRDQLAELGQSFNTMSEHLERLIVVEKEKERLQSEIEIAREVQDQLFPKSVPSLKTLELTGLCTPARMVSGDYYDFLCLPDGKVAVAIGDVAGKGISAALLMASIQSIMRTQLTAGLPARAAAVNGNPSNGQSTSYMVSQLNNQLYASTSPEKYATFWFGLYDEQLKTLTYTNAGHLQPILLHNNTPQYLDVTGTVVGAFPRMNYEEKTVQLESGDLLVAYTDGITEPENEYGEEFGADRLIEFVLKHQNLEGREIIARVMEAVRHWTSAAEMPDDMTLLLARRIG